jgi:phage baseplate assembly protein W
MSSNYKVNISFGEHIKTGWIFKDLHESFDTNKVKRDLRENLDANAVYGELSNLFTYKTVERPLFPDFSLSVEKYLYEPINDLTAKALLDEINLAITKWITRIKIIKSNITPYYDDNTYMINLIFEIPALGKSDYKVNFEVRRDGN